ncbi:MAG: hypothetical protein H0U25_09030 [Thermoleophilaceae bacterium]|nr:hypothetical protein [Thermoleophilaceae bacterium]
MGAENLLEKLDGTTIVADRARRLSRLFRVVKPEARLAGLLEVVGDLGEGAGAAAGLE